jgi:hypothetical protein
LAGGRADRMHPVWLNTSMGIQADGGLYGFHIFLSVVIRNETAHARISSFCLDAKEPKNQGSIKIRARFCRNRGKIINSARKKRGPWTNYFSDRNFPKSQQRANFY